MRCHKCSLTLDWAAISDLRSLEYLIVRLDQWRRQGALEQDVYDTLAGEARINLTKIRALLDAPRPAEVDAPPGPPPFVSRRPSEPPPFSAHRVRPAAPSAPPGPTILDRLVDIGTVRLMLYTGALLLAVGILIWLRDVLRVQLQRPIVQAGLLGTLTLAVLGIGFTLVARARERIEFRTIGRGALFLGTLLLPLNPWFWLRSGLIEDRGNAWIVGLVVFAVSAAIALGLGDRVFAIMSYAAAILTAWLLTFKLTGGASPGAYGLAILTVSFVYLHVERLLELDAAPRLWLDLRATFFRCAHTGILFCLVFYTTVVRFVPSELFAAFRHFNGDGYGSWTGIAIALIAAYAYAYSAVRRAQVLYSYAALLSLLWATALLLADRSAPDGAWLAACGLWTVVALGSGTALKDRPLWGPPLIACGKALAWTGFAASLLVALAYSGAGVRVRWFTVAGAALIALAFAIDVARLRRALEAFASVMLWVLIGGWLVHQLSASWIVTDTVLALAAAMVPTVADRVSATLGERLGSAAIGVRYAALAIATILMVPCAVWASHLTGLEIAKVAAPSVAVAAAFIVAAWPLESGFVRILAFVAGAFSLWLALQTVAIGEARWLAINSRFKTFMYAPVAYILAVLWLALRDREDHRLNELAWAVRAFAFIATSVAAACSLTIVFDATFSSSAYYLFASALAICALVPLIVALAERTAVIALIEGSTAALLLASAYFSLAIALGKESDTWAPLVLATSLGLLPIFMFAVARPLREPAPAIGLPLSAIGGIASVLLMIGLLPIFSPEFHDATMGFQIRDRMAFIVLAFLLAAHGLWRNIAHTERTWKSLFAIAGGVAATMAIYAIPHAFEATDRFSVILLVIASALLFAALRYTEQLREFTVAVAHSSFVIGLALTLGRLLPHLALRDPALTRSLAELAALTFAAWVAGRSASRAARAYSVAWRALAFSAYWTLGIRLGFHPWRDSAYYTLPTGALLVGAGIVSVRRDRLAGGQLLVWLGSFLAALPMLLHALENRYVTEISPVGYDAATIGIGLSLAAVGGLFELRGPALIGTFAVVTDLVVVIFSAIEWSSIPFSIYLTLLGLLLFTVAALILFRRDQLVDLWERFGRRFDTFNSWR